jgi:hypothetical protein
MDFHSSGLGEESGEQTYCPWSHYQKTFAWLQGRPQHCSKGVPARFHHGSHCVVDIVGQRMQ